MKTDWTLGSQIHGFANGYFGRDSYACRVVVAKVNDTLVTINENLIVETILESDASQINDPMDRDYCDHDDDFRLYAWVEN